MAFACENLEDMRKANSLYPGGLGELISVDPVDYAKDICHLAVTGLEPGYSYLADSPIL